MDYGHIPGIDKPISRLVQGTLGINPQNLDEGYALLDEIVAEGCNTFDTAHVYHRGDNERIVGRWIRERGIRDRIVLIAKGAHHNEDRSRVTPFDIEADLHDAFARFGFDYIDIFLLHRDDPRVEVGPIVEILNEYQAAGHIGIFGGSNWSHQRLEAANEYAYAHNLKPFALSSPHFSLAEQSKPPWPGCVSIAGEAGRAARDWYAAHDLALFTWSSLAGGFFSGRFTRDNGDSFSEPLDRVVVDAYYTDANFERLARAESLANERGVTLAQVALAYVMSQPLNIYALVGCRSTQEFRDNAAALALKLTPAELAWLDLQTETV